MKGQPQYNLCIFVGSLNSFIGFSSLINTMLDNIVESFRNAHLWEKHDKNSLKSMFFYFIERSIYIHTIQHVESPKRIQILDVKFLPVIPSLWVPTILRKMQWGMIYEVFGEVHQIS
jgi:hypothetical protein